MLENLTDIIFTGIISATAFEIFKAIFIIIKNKISEKSLPFTVSGYWCTYHEKAMHGAYELVYLKHQGNKLKLKLYQKTNDKRFHFYKGNGYIRGDKISIAYQEANKSRSNHTGTFNLKIHNISEHSVCLYGNYTEFSKNNKESNSIRYELKECNLSSFNRLCIKFLGKFFIKNLMVREVFINECLS